MSTVATKPKARERILTTSTNLFYGHDSHMVGVDKICEVANVSKRTLYKHFSTKETLISASINRLGEEWFEACVSSGSDDPAKSITHVFKMFESMAEVPDFYGCILMNTSIEQRGVNALAQEVAKAFKGKLYDYFAEQGTLLQIKDPKELAEQLVLLHDGCSAWIVMRHKFPQSVFRTLDILLNSDCQIRRRAMISVKN